MEKESMAKEKSYSNHMIPKRGIYFFWFISYIIFAAVLGYLSKNYYKPIENLHGTKNILDIVMNELGNSITFVSGILCLVIDFTKGKANNSMDKKDNCILTICII